MSDCGVCVYYDYDETSTVWNVSFPNARKPHKCCECGRETPIGIPYQRIGSLYDGHWTTLITCSVCAEIRSAFCCQCEMIGNFWDDFEESFGALNESCFDKLQTVEAKKYLRERWMEWKGLQP